jgi:AraC-like DNA-binding protein
MARNVEIVVIAPVGVAVDVKTPCRHSTLVFSSIGEFERWHHGENEEDDRMSTIAPFVRKAMSLTGMTINATRPAMSWLCRRVTVPTVKELAAIWSSRRSFFRAWKEDAPVSPHEFLQLVRSLQAEELLRKGMQAGEVARKTGFRSAAVMRETMGHYPWSKAS